MGFDILRRRGSKDAKPLSRRKNSLSHPNGGILPDSSSTTASLLEETAALATNGCPPFSAIEQRLTEKTELIYELNKVGVDTVDRLSNEMSERKDRLGRGLFTHHVYKGLLPCYPLHLPPFSHPCLCHDPPHLWWDTHYITHLHTYITHR